MENSGKLDQWMMLNTLVVQKKGRSNVNIEAVLKKVDKIPRTSVLRRGQVFQISTNCLQDIFTGDLRHHAYIQLTQEPKPDDHSHER